MVEKEADIFFFMMILVAMAIVFMISLGVAAFLKIVPFRERASIASVSLAVASILFGFTTTSLIRLSGQLLVLNRQLSDEAKELLDLYKLVQKDEELSSKRLEWSMKVYEWGMQGYGEKSPALEAIQSAYRCLLLSVRDRISLSREIVYLFHGVALCLLIFSMLASVLTYVLESFEESTLALSLMTLLLATLMTILGWFFCNRILTQISDSLFNIRHQINGGLCNISPYKYTNED